MNNPKDNPIDNLIDNIIDNLIDYTNYDEVLDVTINNDNNNSEEIDDAQLIYDLIYNNYDTIIKNKELYRAIDPDHNSVTRTFIRNGSTEKEAIILSFWTMMYMCKKLIF